MPTDAQVALWLPISGVVAGALLTGGFTLLGTRFGATNEAKKWRRENRRDAYLSYLATVNDHLVAARSLFDSVFEDPRGTTLAEVDRLQGGAGSLLAAATPLAIVGPESVDRTAASFSKAVNTYEDANFAASRWMIEHRTALPHDHPLLEERTARRKAALDTRNDFVRAAREAIRTRSRR